MGDTVTGSVSSLIVRPTHEAEPTTGVSQEASHGEIRVYKPADLPLSFLCLQSHLFKASHHWTFSLGTSSSVTFIHNSLAMANTSPRLARAVPAKHAARSSVSKHAARNSVSKYTARNSVSKPAARNSVLKRCPNTGLAYTYGPDNKKYDAIFPRSFKRDATVIVSAEGQYLITEKGKRIFTACGGAAVSSLGPAIDERFEDYMRQEIPYINASWGITTGVLEYADRLLATTDGHMKSCRFYNGGTYGLTLNRQCIRTNRV